MIENNLPLVTVIVPCYNHEKYVETCLDSIFRQTYQNIEVIVIDDCSPDNSVEVIKKLQTKHDFKFIEHQENWGLTKTLNDVIYNHAHGKYIKCIASDDYLTDDCVEVLAKKIEELGCECGFVYGKAQTFYYKNATPVLDKILGSNTNRFELLFNDNRVPAAAVIFARNVFIEVGGFEGLFIEDIYLWLSISEKYSFSFIDEVVYYYQINSLVSMSSNYERMHTTMIFIISRFFMRLDLRSQQKYFISFFSAIFEHYSSFKIEYIRRLIKTNKKKAVGMYFCNFFLLLFGKRKLLFTFWFELLK